MMTWDKLISHIVSNRSTSDKYLRDWIRRLILGERESVPYIRLYGPQSSGKTTFCKALGLLVRSIDRYDLWTGTWNGYLLDAQLGILEGPDFRKPELMAKMAEYQRPTITINRMRKFPVTIENKIRWVECVDDRKDQVPPWNFIFFHPAQVSEPIPQSQILLDLTADLPRFRQELVP